MDMKKVLEIAANCGTSVRGHYDETGCTPQELHAFAQEVARIEREECARIADAAKENAAKTALCHSGESESRHRMVARSIEAGYIAAEIRNKA